jgi:DNA topoisomerase-1
MDLATVTLEQALQLLSLPRVVGKDAEGSEITAQNGRYGPYLKKGTDSRSLQSEEQIFAITLEEALAIYAQPKQRGRGTAKPPLKELGTDPSSEKPIVVKDGRYGAYITDGTTNVTLKKDDTLETLTHEIAVERLAEKRVKGPAKRSSSRSSTRRTSSRSGSGSRSKKS